MSRKNIKDSWINKYPVSLRTIGTKIKVLWQWSVMNVEQRKHVLSHTEKKIEGILRILSFSTLVTILLYVSYVAISFVSPQTSDSIKNHVSAFLFGDYQKGKSAYESGDYEKAIEKLLPLAKIEDDSNIQFYVGSAYIQTKGQQNIDKGIKWLRLSAQNQNMDAARQLAKLYFFGHEAGVSPNYAEALAWLTKIAQQGGVDGQMTLARISLLGYKNIEPNEQAAIGWYRHAATNGDLNAIWMLSFLTKDNNVIIENVSGNSNVSLSTGNTDYLAGQYYYGFLVDQDYHTAFELYKKSVEKDGSIFSRFMLAKMYYQGVGTTTNHQEAERLFNELKELAEKYGWARYALGRMYYDGIVVSSNQEEAFKLISASNLGSTSSAMGLLCFALIREGKFAEAMVPCQKAYELEPDSSNNANLGHVYLLSGNDEEAKKYYEKARILHSLESEIALVSAVHDFEFFIKRGWKVSESQAQISLFVNEWKLKVREKFFPAP